MKMTDKFNFQKEYGRLTRRNFLQNAMLVAGVVAVFPPLNGQNKTMMNKYGLFGKLQAQAGKGKELGELLLKGAKLMENAKGCILYVVSKEAGNPDAIYVMEVWESKEDHDNSLKLSGVRELITQAMPILDGKPEGGLPLEVLGGKGLSF
jgi:quinol monooxygenase YgiN